eukprot:110778-Alexandrium_andersonii.AAC.1
MGSTVAASLKGASRLADAPTAPHWPVAFTFQSDRKPGLQRVLVRPRVIDQKPTAPDSARAQAALRDT